MCWEDEGLCTYRAWRVGSGSKPVRVARVFFSRLFIWNTRILLPFTFTLYIIMNAELGLRHTFAVPQFL